MAGTRSVDVSVLTPVLNEAEYLSSVLARMQAQTYDGRIEFLFIDGGSTDDTRQILEKAAVEDSRIRLLENPYSTTAYALNIGLENAHGEYVARMDAHTFYPADYLRLGIDRLELGDVDWVAGPAIAVGNGTWSRRVALALTSRLGYGAAKFRSASEEEFDAVTGFAGVWRRATLERHGGWDVDWPINQDAELAARTIEADERIVCVPAMAADYIPRDSLPALARQYFRYGEYRCKTSGRHPTTLKPANLLPPALALSALVALVGPQPLARGARLGMVLYGITVVTESVRTGTASGQIADSLALPQVFATMHLAHGLGFIAGSVRFGVPADAIVQAAQVGIRGILGMVRAPSDGGR